MSMKQRIFDLILEENKGDYMSLIDYLDSLKSMAFKALDNEKMKRSFGFVKRMSINEYLATFTNERVDELLNFDEQLEALYDIMFKQDELWSYIVEDFDEAFSNSNSHYESMKIALLPDGRLYELPQYCGYDISDKFRG